MGRESECRMPNREMANGEAADAPARAGGRCLDGRPVRGIEGRGRVNRRLSSEKEHVMALALAMAVIWIEGESSRRRRRGWRWRPGRKRLHPAARRSTEGRWTRRAPSLPTMFDVPADIPEAQIIFRYARLHWPGHDEAGGD